MLLILCLVGFQASIRKFGQFYWLGLAYIVFKLNYGFFNHSSQYLFVFISIILALIVTLLLRYISIRPKFSPPSYTNFVYILCVLIFSFGVLRLGIQILGSSWLVIIRILESDTTTRLSLYLGWLLALVLLTKRDKSLTKNLPLWIIVLLMPLMLRIKLLAVPLLFVFFDWRVRRFSFGAMMKVGGFGFLLYLLLMTIRWLGDLNDLSMTDLENAALSVSSAGIEREMYHQFNSVFEFYEHRDKLWFESYMRLPSVILSKIFGTTEIPNPMYQYHLISHNFVLFKGGSAHPSIFADSFANAGWIGVFIPALWLALYEIFSDVFANSAAWHILGLISLVLVVRGSVVYGQMYIWFFCLVYLFVILYNELKRNVRNNFGAFSPHG